MSAARSPGRHASPGRRGVRRPETQRTEENTEAMASARLSHRSVLPSSSYARRNALTAATRSFAASLAAPSRAKAFAAFLQCSADGGGAGEMPVAAAAEALLVEDLGPPAGSGVLGGSADPAAGPRKIEAAACPAAGKWKSDPDVSECGGRSFGATVLVVPRPSDPI